MIFDQKVKYLLSLFGLTIFITFVVIPAFSGTRPVSPDYYIGPVRIHMYSWIMLAAIIAGFFIAKKLARISGIETRHIENLVIINTLTGLIGARAYHVATAWDYYSQDFSQVYVIWQGGLGIFGGLAAGVIATFFYAKIVKISFLRLADILSPALAIGLALGRWGNFFNYEAYGIPTDMPWKMFVPVVFRMPEYLDRMFYHPVFLYESFGLLALGWLAFWIFLRKKELAGYTFAVFLLVYFIGRYMSDNLRIQNLITKSYVHDFFAISAIILSLILLVWLSKQRLQKV